MTVVRRDQLMIKMLICRYTVQDLLSKLSALEIDDQLSADEKFLQIKNIREEMSKVGTEVDDIKKEITLLNTYSVN